MPHQQTMQKLLVATLLWLTTTVQALASDSPLDSLMNRVLEGSHQEVLQARTLVNDFDASLGNAGKRLQSARSELERINHQNVELEDRLLSLQKQLREQQKQWGAEKQDLQELLENVSDQSQVLFEQVRPYGLWSLDTTGAKPLSEETIGLNDIRQLWQAMVQQIIVSGRIHQSQELIIDRHGNPRQAQVTRYGPFTSSAQPDNTDTPVWVSFLPEQQVWAELTPQPELSAPEQGMIIDPSFGTLLVQHANAPGWLDKLKPAGMVGLLIALTGLIGLGIALVRIIALNKEQRSVSEQQQALDSANPSAIHAGNSLGRVMLAAQRMQPEFLENGIDEAVLREVPPLRYGLGTLAVLAGIPPLLGLLGTVGGMIETFNVISSVGSANSQLLSGGIAQALLTTKLGLMTAIPLLLLHCALKNKSNALIELLEQQAAGLLVQHRLATSRKPEHV